MTRQTGQQPYGSAEFVSVELAGLWSDYNDADRCQGAAADKRLKNRYKSRMDALWGQIQATENAASFAKPEGPLGVILLMCMISEYGEELDNLVPRAPDDFSEGRAGELSKALTRMAYSVVRWIEDQHSVSRLDAAGNVYLPRRCDPFDPQIEVTAEAVEAA